MSKNLNGIIIINKEKNCTSHDIVHKIKLLFNEKVGHTGTLDPMARGVLPILIGKGTLCSKYLINHDKVYEATIQLGQKRDTKDSEGVIIDKKRVTSNMLEQANIEQVLLKFIGKQEQIPPMFSAIKVKGKKLYEYARKGEKIEVQPRKIEIYSLKLLNVDKKMQQIKIKVHCSKGTYIRTLCENISEKLGTVGYMLDLNRLQVGNFNIKDAISINELEEEKDNSLFIEKHLIKIEDLFSNSKEIIMNEKKINLLLNGVKLTYNLNDGTYKIYLKKHENTNNLFVGTGIIKNNLLKRDIIVEDKFEQ